MLRTRMMVVSRMMMVSDEMRDWCAVEDCDYDCGV